MEALLSIRTDLGRVTETMHAVGFTIFGFRDTFLDRKSYELRSDLMEKLFYLDGKSHDPIDLYIESPGDTAQESLAIEHVVRILKSPVNTWNANGGAIPAEPCRWRPVPARGARFEVL